MLPGLKGRRQKSCRQDFWPNENSVLSQTLSQKSCPAKVLSCPVKIGPAARRQDRFFSRPAAWAQPGQTEYHLCGAICPASKGFLRTLVVRPLSPAPPQWWCAQRPGDRTGFSFGPAPRKSCHASIKARPAARRRGRFFFAGRQDIMPR